MGSLSVAVMYVKGVQKVAVHL